MIGHGSSKEGSHGVHGAPLGASDLKAVKQKFGFNPEEVPACPVCVEFNPVFSMGLLCLPVWLYWVLLILL